VRFNPILKKNIFPKYLILFPKKNISFKYLILSYKEDLVIVSLFKPANFVNFPQGFSRLSSAKIAFLSLNFPVRKTFKRVLNRVFIIGIIGVVLYLTLSLFRSIQVRYCLSVFDLDKRLSKS